MSISKTLSFSYMFYRPFLTVDRRVIAEPDRGASQELHRRGIVVFFHVVVVVPDSAYDGVAVGDAVVDLVAAFVLISRAVAVATLTRGERS